MSIPYQFRDQELMQRTITHPSYSRGAREQQISYERLEFFGDSILSMVITEVLYRRHGLLSEGQMSIMHANLVNAKSVAMVAKSIDLGEILLMDIGEETSGGRENISNLENAMEALIAGVYLDSDYTTVFKFIENLWQPLLQSVSIAEKDKKTVLQEWAQFKRYNLPLYLVEKREGLAHAPVFIISVQVHEFKALGRGKSKREAEHNAAAELLSLIQEE